MSHSLEQHWMQRARFLTQTLILSGTLNIGLLSSIIYFNLRDKMTAISYEVPSSIKPEFTNEQVLRAYSRASFQDLLLRLESKDLIEEGYSKRDLALACLTAFHHFNIEKALGGILLQKRLVAFRNAEGNEMVELVSFVGLKDEHFEALLQFARTEKWPLTPKGVFFEISRMKMPCDPSLLEAFYCTAEFHNLYALMQKNIPEISRSRVIDLLKEGTWDLVKRFSDSLRVYQSYNVETFREFLVSCALDKHSKIAMDFLSQYEMEYMLKKFDDTQLMICLDLQAGEKEKMEPLARQLLVSQRSDNLRKKAALVLYALAGEEAPLVYDYTQALHRFGPKKVFLEQKAPVILLASSQKGDSKAPVLAVLKKGMVHKVQAGDSLWKIAKKYGVSVESIMKLNHLESDRLKLGKDLQISEK